MSLGLGGSCAGARCLMPSPDVFCGRSPGFGPGPEPGFGLGPRFRASTRFQCRTRFRAEVRVQCRTRFRAEVRVQCRTRFRAEVRFRRRTRLGSCDGLMRVQMLRGRGRGRRRAGASWLGAQFPAPLDACGDRGGPGDCASDRPRREGVSGRLLALMACGGRVCPGGFWL
ncbi:hypothetical protein J2X68_003759 [Streptomyces sp. 3330]|nr:hypothetical protein [Streptomyces sp. 3330]